MTDKSKPDEKLASEHDDVEIEVSDEEATEPEFVAPGENEESEEPEFTVHDHRFWAHEDGNEGAAGDEGDGEDEEQEKPKAPSKPTYIQKLEAQIEEQEERLKSYIEAHKAAEKRFEESAARLARQVDAEVERARDDLVKKLFDVLDNLDRSVEAASSTESFEGLRDGVAIVQRQFLGLLEQMGLAKVDPAGEDFDPAYHEAVSVVPVAKEKDDQKVQHVLRCGYRRGETVLRPAMVTVGRKA